MSAPEFFWYYVSHDGEYPWEPEGRRAITLDDLSALASSIDRLPYAGALVATTGHDVWVLGSAAAALSKRFKPLLAVRPQFVSVTTLANMAISFDNLFGDRLLLNVINSENPIWRQNGIWLDNDERYALHEEYWHVFDRLVAGEKVTFDGQYIKVENALANPWLDRGRDHVPLWFSGSSAPALRVAGRFADAYLTFAEPAEQLTAKTTELLEIASQFSRTPTIGLRASVITAPTDAEAWQKADRLLHSTSRATLERKLGFVAKGGNGGGTSVTQSRIFDLLPEKALEGIRSGRLPESARELSFDGTLWPGIALLQQGPPIALVGGYDSIVQTLREYHALGVETFILDSLPLLEGAYDVAEHIITQFTDKEHS